MSQDTGKTIVSDDLKGLLDDESVVSDESLRLPTIKVVIKYKESSAEIQCDVMMIDESSVTLANFPIRDSFDMFKARLGGSLESVILKLSDFEFVFSAPSVSVSVTDSSTCLVSLSQLRGE